MKKKSLNNFWQQLMLLGILLLLLTTTGFSQTIVVSERDTISGYFDTIRVESTGEAYFSSASLNGGGLLEVEPGGQFIGLGDEGAWFGMGGGSKIENNSGAENVRNFTISLRGSVTVGGSEPTTAYGVFLGWGNRHIYLENDLILTGKINFNNYYIQIRMQGNNVILGPDAFFHRTGDARAFLAAGEGGVVKKMLKPGMNTMIPMGANWDTRSDLYFSVNPDAVLAEDAAITFQLYQDSLNANAQGDVVANYMQRFVNIGFENVSNPDFNVQLKYSDGDIVGELSQMRSAIWDGSTWQYGLPINQQAKLMEWSNLDRAATLTAGKDLGLDQYLCEAPTGLYTSGVTPNTATLNWEAVPGGAESYTVEYKLASAGTWTEVTGINDTFYELTALTDNESYQWRVKTDCDAGANYQEFSNYSETIDFSTPTDNGCYAPTDITVSGETNSTADVAWTHSGSPDAFMVEYRHVGATAWTVFSPNPTTTSCTLNGLDDGMQYEVRVKTICTSGSLESYYSDPVVFNTVISGYNETTKTLVVTTERTIPTFVEYNFIYVEDGGTAIATQDVTVNEEFVVKSGGALYLDQYSVYGDEATFDLQAGATIRYAKHYLKSADNPLFSAINVGSDYSFNQDANYILNGTVAGPGVTDGQEIINPFPSTVNNLTIEGPGKVGNAKRFDLTVNGTLLINGGYMHFDSKKLILKGGLVNNSSDSAHVIVSDGQPVVIASTGEFRFEEDNFTTERLQIGTDNESPQAILDVNVEVLNEFTLRSGSVNLNRNTLTIPGFKEATGQIIAGDGGTLIHQLTGLEEKTIPFSNGTDLFTTTIFPTAGTFPAEEDQIFSGVALTMRSGVNPPSMGAAPEDYLTRYLDIEFIEVQNPVYNASFVYSESDITGNENELEVQFYNGTEWENSYQAPDVENNLVAWNGLSQDGVLTAGKYLGYDAPPCPVPAELENFDITTQGASFAWTYQGEGVGSFNLHYALNQGGATWNAQNSIAETNHRIGSGLTSDTEYQWYIESVCPEFGSTGISDTITFSTLTGSCDPPIEITLLEQDTTSVKIGWSEGSANFTVEYQPAGGDWSNSTTVENVSDQFLVLENLQKDAMYDVRVASACGTSSEVFTFHTLIAGWDEVTNILYINTERIIPTIKTFNAIVIEAGGVATAESNISVVDSLIVLSGGELHCGENTLSGTQFRIENGATLGIGHPDGIMSAKANEGNIQFLATNYGQQAEYIYNGTQPQTLGDALTYAEWWGQEAEYDYLTIDNPTTVTAIGKNIAVNEKLWLKQGQVIVQDISRQFKINSALVVNDASENAMYSQEVTTIFHGSSILSGTFPTRFYDLKTTGQDNGTHFTSELVIANELIIVDKYLTPPILEAGVTLRLEPGAKMIKGEGKFLKYENEAKFVLELTDSDIGITRELHIGEGGNYLPVAFTANSGIALDADAEVEIQPVPRAHPERGGSVNFIERHVLINGTNISSPNYDLTMQYLDSEVIGDETSFLNSFYGTDWTTYTNVNAADNIASVQANTEWGGLTAGFDLGIPAQACDIPDGLQSSNITYATASLAWTGITGAEGYMVAYRPVGATDWTTVEVTSTSSIISDLIDDTEYQWKVKTLCELGYEAESDYSAAETFTTLALQECLPPENTNEDDISAASAVLSWDAVTGAQDYVLQYQITGESSWQNLTSTSGSTTVEIADLLASSEYHWRVKTLCIAGFDPESQYAANDTFQTTAPCDPATNLSTENIYWYGADLHWSPDPNAQTQALRYREQGAGIGDWETHGSLSATDNSMQLFDVLAPLTDYEWQVRTFCTNGGISPFTSSDMFSTIAEPVCELPINLNVTEISTSTATLNWSPGSGTIGEYGYEVAYRIKGEDTWTYSTQDYSPLELTGLPQGTEYEWKVKALCTQDDVPWANSGYTNIQTFKTYMVCSDAPTNLTATSPNWCYAELGWDAVFGITKYEIRYRETGAADWIEKTLTDKNSTTIFSLEGDTEYEWQVRTYCFGTETNSDWSEVQTFSTIVNDGSPCGGPTDNPYETFYGSAPDWTYDLAWENIINIQSYDDGSGYWDAAVMSAQQALGGSGVVYFPAGTYHFQEHVQLLDGIIFRGETPVVTNAKSEDFSPPTKFVFPKYEPTFEGDGTPNHTAFKSIVSPSLRSNTGLVYLDINRAHVGFKVPLVDMPGYSTPQPVGEKTNVMIFGIRNNNVAVPEPNIPKTWEDEGVSQHGWQRFSYRFGVNISVYVTANGIVANCRVNDFENNTVNPVEDDGYDQPGYLVQGTYSGTLEQPTGASGNGFTTIQYGERARFSYTDHYGIEVNRGKPYQTFGTPEAEPSLYAPGIEVLDNWVYTTRRVGIMASGDGLLIKGNIKKDKLGKRAFLNLVGDRLQGNNSATYENRGIDWSGHNVTVADNYLEVARNAIMYSGYLSIDGEGILIQECCGGSSVDGISITGNTMNAYIGVYKMRDIKDVYIADNTFYDWAPGDSKNIYVSANTNNQIYRADNVRIENNHNVSGISLAAGVGACSAYILNNEGSGNINAPCYTIVEGNQGLVNTTSNCPPEATCTEMNTAPEITSFTPTEGAAGYEVEISGTLLYGTDSVFFNQTKATSFEVIDESTVKAIVPEGATTGKITIYTNTAYWDVDHYVFPASAQSADDFTIGQGVAELSFDPAGGIFDAQQSVSISTTTDGTTIYYTTDGTEPEEGAGTSQEYTEPISVGENMTIKAKGFKTGMYPSLTAAEDYIVQLITADFSATTVNLGEATEFYNLSSVTTGSITQVLWDFDNNGSTDATGDTVQHTFATEGFHDVTLTVKTNYDFSETVTLQVEVTNNSSISDVNNNLGLLKVYPNPTKGELHIDLTNPTNGEVKLLLTDQLGRTILLRKYEKFGENFRKYLNIEDLSPGVYLLEIKQGDQRAIKRVTKN